MSKISFPRRKPIASFGAPAFLKARPLVDVAVAGLLIAILGFPALFDGAYNIQASSKSSSEPAPYSEPPQAFGTASPSRFSGLFSTIVSNASDAIASLKPDTVPAGLKSGKLPTISERLMSKVGLVGPAIEPPPLPQPPSVVDYDFDNDGKTDIGRWHPANSEIKIKNSNGGSESIFSVGCIPPASPCSSQRVVAPGDFNGDGQTDAAIFDAGTWTYKTSTLGSAQTISWGTAGDIPVAGDYDGDGITDAAIYRPSTNTWWVSKSTGGYTSTALGTAGDIVVPGDYNGDGKNDVAVYRPSNGYWYINPSGGSSYTFAWGISSDTPVPADYDGDGKTDPAVFRPSTGTWYAYRSFLNNGSYYTQTWGNYGDQPVPGDYDGDNKADYAIWRPTNGSWYTLKSSDSSYSIQTLGVPGDTAVPSAYLKQVGGQITGDALAAARLSPRNATGGTNLYSQNFSWSTSLVSLPGRSGLDAGFGISYNSLVWTKVGSAIVFDADRSNATPGFRFGFPTIEPIYYDDEKDVWAYMMITPSGGRAEFRQTLVTNTYETADSSYTQLVVNGAANPNDPVEAITITVTSTEGTQMSYAWSMGAYRCTQIKDRNGNYISMVYDAEGRLSTMTDTLGRAVTVNYDGTTGLPGNITQTWKDSNGYGSTVTHTWATFTYTTKTVDTDFHSSITTIVGPPDGTPVSVLDKITYPDSSSTKFEYNGYIQVKKVSSIAADSSNHVLNSVETSLANPGSGQSDCPRFASTSTVTENFNGGTAVVVTNDAPTSSSFTGPNGSETTSMVKVAMTGHPNSLYSRIHYAPSGWKEGLSVATEDCVSSVCTGTDRKRWTWNDWTQDNTGASYITNPRVKESRVGDAATTKKTKITYYEPTTGSFPYGLPEKIEIFGGSSLTTVLKTQTTAYNLSSNYTSRRIIGLPAETQLFEGSSTLMSKFTYAYDESGYNGSGQSASSPTQHDSSYGTGFSYRGNRTSTTRVSVTNSSDTVTTHAKFNILGSPISQTDPRGRISTISYADDWNDSASRTTYAYPTTVTDPGGFTSTIEYRFDTGANVWARSPTPSGTGNSDGKTTTRTYDVTTGRIIKEMVLNAGGAYTEYDYAAAGNAVTTFTTIVDAGNDGADSSDEVATLTEFDGAGRVRRTRTENPNSTGGYTGVLTEYDILGRAKRQSLPTEINSSWQPAGDDYRGMSGSDYIWLWNSTEYDWKGRTTRVIPSDSTGSDGKDTIYEYTGCGCSGGLTTTIKGPQTTAKDVAGTLQTSKRRWQKIYEDALGRVEKTEIWDLDGAGSAPYSTVKTTLNGRDQPTAIVEYAGSDTSSTYQTTTMTYDGHGRLSTKHLPEYASNTDMAWTYRADDAVATVTDPRGAVTTYKYGQLDSDGTEDRALLTRIAYSSPNTSTIPDPTDVTFTYDNAGNRTYMSDESGNLTYTYDELSRLKTETKNFADTLSSAASGGYELSYAYHLTGSLKSINAPFDRDITYSVDKIGRTISIGNGTTDDAYADNVTHRAFGGLKAMALSATDPIDVSVTYDEALRPVTYEADSAANSSEIQKASYSYAKDGMLSTLDNQADAKFDQVNTYDFAGRLKANDVGTSGVAFPFKQILSYDAFDNLTSRTNWTYGLDPVTFSATYADNRKTLGGSSDSYDAAGNVVVSNQSSPVDEFAWKFDAAGRQSRWEEYGPYGDTQRKAGETSFDGDGRAAKVSDLTKTSFGGVWGSWNSNNEYFIYSSVTGKKVTSLDSVGAHYRTHVYLGSARIADERNGSIVFNSTDPLTGSTRETDEDGATFPGDESETRVELAGLDTLVPHTTPPSMPEPNYAKGGSAGNAEGGCVVDGVFQSPSSCSRGLANGTMAQCPDNNCGPRVVKDRHGRERFTDPYSFSGGIGGWRVQDDKKKKKKKQPPTLKVVEKDEAKRRKEAHQKAGYIPDPRDPEAEYIHAPLPDAMELRGKIVERLDADGGRCRKFLDSVRNNLDIERTIEELFNEVIEDGGSVVIAHDIEAAGVAYYGEDEKDIGLAPVSDSAERYTNRAIHELFHRAGRGHRAFAEAGFDSLSEADQATFPFPKVKSPGSRDMDDTYSNYFSQLQNHFCKPKL